MLHVQNHGAGGRQLGRWHRRGSGLRGLNRCSCGLVERRLNDRIGAGGSCGSGRPRQSPRLRRFIDFSGFQGLAGMVGSVIRQVFVRYLRLRQKELMVRREREIVRDVQLF